MFVRSMSLWVVAPAVVFFIACGKSRPLTTADTIVIDATFFTADSTEIEAVALKGERILATGSKEEILKLQGPATQVVSLPGKFVMPGLIEGHGHFHALGRSLIEPNLLDARSYDEVITRIVQAKEFMPKGAWISGRGWHQEKWATSPKGAIEGYPTHHALSAVTPDQPVILSHASGHAILANKKAMELAGVNGATKDPPGGRIVRDKSGTPIGVFEENAATLIQEVYAQYLNSRGKEERYTAFSEAVKKASQEALSYGITSFQDAGSTLDEVQMYRRVTAQGLLHTRLWVMFMQPKKHEFESAARAVYTDTVQHMLKVAAVKAYFDGALGSYGAWLLEPYTDKPGFTGQNTTPIDSIRALAEFCKAKGLQFCVHAIGDRANREVLNVFESVAGSADQDHRWRVEHAQHLHPADIGRFAALGVIASMQPIHCTSDQPFVVKRLGEQRAKAGAYPWRSLIDSGARYCGGTDVPVESINPFANMYAAVTRRRPDTDATLYPEQALTRREALLAYTAWNAWAAKEEHLKGRIAPGLLADLVVLDRNLLTCSEKEILQTRVEQVYLGGKRLR